MNIPPLHPKQFVWCKVDFKIEVTRVPRAMSRPAHPLQSQMLSVTNSLGDAHLKLPGLEVQVALWVTDGHLQFDGAPSAAIGIHQVDHDLCMVIAPRSMTAGAAHAHGGLAEQGFKEITATRIRLVTSSTREFEATVPVWRWMELPVAAVLAAHVVVRRAALRILEYLVSLGHFLELGFSIRFLAHVRMVLASELPVGALDVLQRSGLVHAQSGVVVLEFHPRSCTRTRPYRTPARPDAASPRRVHGLPIICICFAA